MHSGILIIALCSFLFYFMEPLRLEKSVRESVFMQVSKTTNSGTPTVSCPTHTRMVMNDLHACAYRGPKLAPGLIDQADSQPKLARA